MAGDLEGTFQGHLAPPNCLKILGTSWYNFFSFFLWHFYGVLCRIIFISFLELSFLDMRNSLHTCSCSKVTSRMSYNLTVQLIEWKLASNRDQVKKIQTLVQFNHTISLYYSSSYFRILVEQFEVQLQQYRQQIEELENHLATQANNSHITPQGKCFSSSFVHEEFSKLTPITET